MKEPNHRTDRPAANPTETENASADTHTAPVPKTEKIVPPVQAVEETAGEEQEKPKKRFRLDSDELAKIVACGVAIVMLYLFFRATVDIGNFKEAFKIEELVVYGLKQLLNIIFGYLITLILRIKNEKLQFWLTFIFAFIVDNLFVFEATGFEFSTKNIILLVFIAVIFTLFILKTIFHKRILAKIEGIEDEEKKSRRKKAYWIFYWVLFALTMAASVVYAILVLKK